MSREQYRQARILLELFKDNEISSRDTLRGIEEIIKHKQTTLGGI